MPQYDLHVLCPRCGLFHDMFLRVALEESFEVRCLTDIYDADRVPPEFYQTTSGQECPITGQSIDQLNSHQMVLVNVTRLLPKAS